MINQLVKDKAENSLCQTHATDHKSCPVFLTLGLIANKWSVSLLHHLMNAGKKPMRFSQLQKSMTGISQRELSKHLKEFEKSGLVLRRAFPEVPPRVEYSLTPLGQSLLVPIEALAKWAEEHGEELQRNRLNATA